MHVHADLYKSAAVTAVWCRTFRKLNAMDRDPITELTSTLIHSDGVHTYNLRVIEYKNKEGVPTRKFGLSEFFWCDKSRRTYPSKKHHVFLPMTVWSKLLEHNDLITSYATLPAVSNASVPTDKDGKGSNKSSNAASQPAADVERQSSATAAAPSAGRRRGRPPKCADEHAGDGADNARPQAKTRRVEHEATAKKDGFYHPIVLDEDDAAGISADDERTMPFQA